MEPINNKQTNGKIKTGAGRRRDLLVVDVVFVVWAALSLSLSLSFSGRLQELENRKSSPSD